MTDPLARADAVLAAGGLAGRVVADHPLGPLTTYRVGGSAARFVIVESVEDLDAVARAAAAGGLPVLAVGRGSNLLVADRGFAGIAVQLGQAFAQVDIDGVAVRSGGAASLPVVARRTAAAGLTGFEWAVGVPGSIGGAVRMNAGGHGSDIASSLTDADIVTLDGEAWRRTLSVDELGFGYRRSLVGAADVVIGVTLRLARGLAESSLAMIDEIVRWRRENQPGGQNAGSVFTNPPGDSAGRLIDAAGCKGMRVGSAEVSPKHANFFQADDGGSADDVFALMVAVRRRVLEVHGVELEPETRLVGFTADAWSETNWSGE
ncbi:MAG TPA: UDP-N-acetylmuramate dehydrogenase [Acidimicrobiales bacterium]|jgi:UDP-N-acetylmuramate dehydrogenase|nr:UDP-N-acetylmuramate dehydrogenase [Acidimicrobiales bacterium]